MITALDIINDAHHLPSTHIPASRKWRKSQVSPMGGRIIFELLSCNTEEVGKTKQKFIRININDGITALPDCHSGPGESCPLELFAERMKRRGEEVGGFAEVCGMEKDDGEGEEGITFLHQ
jgi:acid phosphatase